MVLRFFSNPRWVIATLAVVAVMAASPTLKAEATEFTAKMQSVDDLKAVFATVESVDVIAARARNTGTIRGLNVEEGDLVQAGQVIARVRDPKLELEIKALDAKLSSIDAERKLAKTDLIRARSLRKSGAGSQARLDQAETRLEVADRNWAAMKAERAVITERQSEGAVRAPKTGRVLKVNVTDGTVVVAGEQVAMIAVESYVLRLRLPERHARSLKTGETVSVLRREIDASNHQQTKRINGTIVQIYPKIEAGRVVADINVAGLGTYFVGERVRVYVSTGSRSVIIVPDDYITWRYGLSFVRLKNNREVVVQVGERSKNGIEILSGLKPGDVLIKADMQKGAVQ